MARFFLGPLILFAIFTATFAAASNDPIIPPLEKIKPDHPRLLLRPNETPNAISLASLRAVSKNDPGFTTMLSQLKAQNSANAQAMVFLLTQDATAADKAIARMRAYRYPGKVDTFHIYFRLTEFALAYDWLYNAPQFTPDIKAEIRANLAPLVREALRVSNDHLFHNYVWMSAGGLALWSFATAGEDDASNQTFNTIRDRFNDRLFAACEYLDGQPSEPMGYWSLYVFTPGLYTLLAAQSATDTDLISLVNSKHNDWLNRNLLTLIHATLPDLRYIPWGDLQSGPNGGVTRDMAGAIDAATWALRSKEGLQYSSNLANKLGLSRFRADTAIFYMLYTRALKDRIKESAAWPSLSHLAGNNLGGSFIARSSWNDDATLVAFRCTDHFGDHHHFDQGSFLIYRRGPLAVDPPVYKQTRGPQQKTEYHNTLLIGGKPQRPVHGQTFPTLAEFQRNLIAGRHLETGDILFSHDAGAWCAVAGQFAQAYDEPTLSSCVRQLLFIRPGTVIVVDHLIAKPAQRLPDVQWLLQLPSSPTAKNGVLVGTNGPCWLRCRAVLPAAVTPKLDPTPVNTQCATYTYPGGAEIILVHMLEVGEGQDWEHAAPISAKTETQTTRISIADQTFLFSGQLPFDVKSTQTEPAKNPIQPSR